MPDPSATPIRELHTLRVPFPAPSTDAERDVIARLTEHADDDPRRLEDGPFRDALLSLGDDLTALRSGTSPERAALNRAAYDLGLHAWAESDTLGLFDAYLSALDNAAADLGELHRQRRGWTAERERFEAWLDEAEALIGERGQG